jgi:hypothetical protein
LAASAPPDARDLVRQALKNWEADAAKLTAWIYNEKAETRDLDDAGKVKSVTSKTQEIRMIEGSPYRRLLERDGKPIPPGEQELQESYLKDNIERRKSESPADRARRIAEYERRRDRFLAAIREIPDAFDYKIVGEENLAGRKAWVIDGVARPGYQPKDRYSHVFPQLAGRLWIDQQDVRWVKIHTELTDIATFGWIVVRIAKGGRAEMEQLRLDDGAWAPKRNWYRVAVRIGLLKHFHLEEEDTYSNYSHTK